jgi:hypothetical protein
MDRAGDIGRECAADAEARGDMDREGGAVERVGDRGLDCALAAGAARGDIALDCGSGCGTCALGDCG